MKSVTKEQRGVSLTRLFAAVCTLGLSLPFIGVRRTRTTVRKVTP